MKSLIVSEDKEIIADGKRMLLEKGDKIIINEGTTEIGFPPRDMELEGKYEKIKLLSQIYNVIKHYHYDNMGEVILDRVEPSIYFNPMGKTADIKIYVKDNKFILYCWAGPLGKKPIAKKDFEIHKDTPQYIDMYLSHLIGFISSLDETADEE